MIIFTQIAIQGLLEAILWIRWNNGADEIDLTILMSFDDPFDQFLGAAAGKYRDDLSTGERCTLSLQLTQRIIKFPEGKLIGALTRTRSPVISHPEKHDADKRVALLFLMTLVDRD